MTRPTASEERRLDVVRGMTRAGHSGCRGGLSFVQTQRGNDSSAQILFLMGQGAGRLGHHWAFDKRLTVPPFWRTLRQKASQPWLALGMSRATWYRLGKPETKPERPLTQPLRARLMNVSLRSLQRGERVARSAPGLADQVAAGALKIGRAERLLFSPTFKEMRQNAVNETPQRRSSGRLAIVRLTHIDGKLPNLALMKIAAEHRRRGNSVVFTKHVERSTFEPTYDRVYGSAIFAYDHSLARVAILKREFPNAIVGGTHNLANPITVEAVLGIEETAPLDYSIYPAFDASIGFTQRGCRLKCGFCVVPKKEGENRSAATIAEIWRGPPHAKHLHLLDNDFFGQPRDQWEARVDEIRTGGFRVCFNQGNQRSDGRRRFGQGARVDPLH